MNKALLKLILWLGPLWRRFDINPVHLYTILEAKLLMDGRRRNAFTYQRSNYGNKPVQSQDLIAMLMFLILGGMFTMFLSLFDHPASGLTFYFSGWMVLLALTLISDFTDVLIDVRDNYILLPRPVNDRTLAVSRLLHIFFYLTKLVIPFALPASIYLTVKQGVGGLILFLLEFPISVLMAIFLVNLIYLLMLRYTTAQRFREIINYVQIAFSTVTVIGYNFLPQMIRTMNLQQVNLLESPAWWWAPSAWLGALWDVAIGGNLTWVNGIMSLVAVCSPVIVLFLISRILSQGFTRRLMAIGEGGGPEIPPKQRTEQGVGQSWMSRTANWVCPNPVERASYELTWRITERSRDFKLKFYPAFIFIPAYLLYMLFFSGDHVNPKERMSTLNNDNIYLFLLYFSLLIIITGVNNLAFSNAFRAAWFWKAAPLSRPGLILSGAFKVMVVRFFAPFYLGLTILLTSIWGISVLDDCLLGLTNNLLVGLLINMLVTPHLPFSKPWEEAGRGQNVATAFLMMIIGGLAGGLHYFIRDYTWLILLMSGVGVWVIYLLFGSFQRMSWRELKLGE